MDINDIAKALQHAAEQLTIANEVLQRHEDQLARVRNVITAGLEMTHLTKPQAQSILRDIADILNIALEV